MNSLVMVNIFTVILHIICILVSLTTASEIGESSCMYLGEFQSDGKKCRKDVVKIERLPKKCSSFVYDGVVCKPDYSVEPKDRDFGLERIKSLVYYEDKAHKVYLHFSHGSTDDWYNVLFTGDFLLVAQSVDNFRGAYPVKGLILRDLENSIYCNEIENFYQNFTAYVKAIKDMNQNLEIGLFLSARTFIERVNGIDQTPYFDFSLINAFMDFYVIEFATFNYCTEELLHGGITPMESSNPNILSLNQFVDALKNSTIATDKLYFEFLISPKPSLSADYDFVNCEKSYNEYCENKNDQRNKWCADNSDILYKKGAFASQYAKGFIGRYIDLVDRDDNCGCGKYVSFEMMVNGFNQKDDPKNCEPLK